MINPCAVKGIGIFLEAAARMPRWQFAAVPGWGTTAEDRAALARLPNVRILPNAPRIDDILAQTRILMMPSLWYEGFGLIVMEAMLRGIPVVASDSGGLKEAKEGTNYVIPVRTIERYEAAFDEHAMPKPVLPVNDEEPWVAALHELLTDREAYNRESSASRQAAQRFVQSLIPQPSSNTLQICAPALKSCSPKTPCTIPPMAAAKNPTAADGSSRRARPPMPRRRSRRDRSPDRGRPRPRSRRHPTAGRVHRRGRRLPPRRHPLLHRRPGATAS